MPDSESLAFSSTDSAINEAAHDNSWAQGKEVARHVESIGLDQQIKQERFIPELLLEAMERAQSAWDLSLNGGTLVRVVDYRDADWKPGQALEIILTIRQHTFNQELERARERVSRLRPPKSGPETPAPTPEVPPTPGPKNEDHNPVAPPSPESSERVAQYGQFTVNADSFYDTFVGQGKGNAIEVPLLGANKNDIDNYVLRVGFDQKYGTLNIENVSRWNNVQVAIKLEGVADDDLPKGAQRTDDGWVTIRLGHDKYSNLSRSQSRFLNDNLLRSGGLAITIDQSENMPDYNEITREKLPRKTFRLISERRDWKEDTRFTNSLESITFRQVGFSEGGPQTGSPAAPESTDAPENPATENNTLERALREDETYRDLMATNDDALAKNEQVTEKLKQALDILINEGSVKSRITETNLDHKIRIDCQKKPKIVIGGNIARSEVYLASREPEATEWINIEAAEGSMEDAALSLVVQGASVLPTSLSDRRVTFIYRDRKKPESWESLDVLSVIDEGYSEQQKQIEEITAGLKPHNFRFEVESTDKTAEAYEINFTDLNETKTDNNSRITGLTFVIHKRERKNTP